MGLKKYVVENLISNTTEFHLYIHEAHANASDSNSGLDPNFPLASWAAAEAKTPLDTKAHLFWHMGPHSGSGYTLTPCRQRILRNCNWYILGDGGGNDALARNVLTSGSVASSADNAIFIPVSVPAAHAWKGKSLRWTSGANSGAGFDQELRTITSQTGGIILANPVANTIQPGDTFEVFIGTTNLLLLDSSANPPSADLEPIFNATGLIPSQAPRDISAPPTPNYVSQDNSTGRIVLVNVNLLGTLALPSSHFLVIRESALVMYGVTNMTGLGDDTGGSYQGFYQGADILMGYDTVLTYVGATFSAKNGPFTGLASTDSQWVGWGRGHGHGNQAVSQDTPFLLCLGGNHRGFVSSPSFVITNGRLGLYGNSIVEPGSIMGFGVSGLGGVLELGLFAGGIWDYTTITGDGPLALDLSSAVNAGFDLVSNLSGSPALELGSGSHVLWLGGDITCTPATANTEVVRLLEGSSFTTSANLSITDGNGAQDVMTIGGITRLTQIPGINYADAGCRWTTEVGTPAGGTIADYSDSRTVQTTDATVTTILTYTTRSDLSVISIHATVWGIATGTGDAAKYVIEATFYRDGSSVVTQKNVAFLSTYESQAAWNASFTISGQDIWMQVQGDVGTVVDWRCKATIDESVGTGGA